MELGDLLAIMLMGAVAGWLASAIVKSERLGLLGSINSDSKIGLYSPIF